MVSLPLENQGLIIPARMPGANWEFEVNQIDLISIANFSPARQLPISNLMQ
jgi:hypothetical protein